MLNKVFIASFALTVMVALCWNTDAQVVTDGLLSYWPLSGDTISNETIADLVGNQQGLIVGDPQVVTGKVAEALAFDGDDHIEIPDEMGGKDAITITIWVKPTDFSSDRTVAGYWLDAATSEILLYYKSSSNVWRFIVRDSSGAAKDITVADPVIDEWTHLAACYENGGELCLYVNGVKTGVEAPANPLNAGNPPWFGIGWDNSGGHPPFVGIMDEVCFYEQALTQAEVEQNYNSEAGIAPVAVGKLVSLWGKVKSR